MTVDLDAAPVRALPGAPESTARVQRTRDVLLVLMAMAMVSAGAIWLVGH